MNVEIKLYETWNSNNMPNQKSGNLLKTKKRGKESGSVQTSEQQQSTHSAEKEPGYMK